MPRQTRIVQALVLLFLSLILFTNVRDAAWAGEVANKYRLEGRLEDAEYYSEYGESRITNSLIATLVASIFIAYLERRARKKTK